MLPPTHIADVAADGWRPVLGDGAYDRCKFECDWPLPSNDADKVHTSSLRAPAPRQLEYMQYDEISNACTVNKRAIFRCSLEAPMAARNIRGRGRNNNWMYWTDAVLTSSSSTMICNQHTLGGSSPLTITRPSARSSSAYI